MNSQDDDPSVIKLCIVPGDSGPVSWMVWMPDHLLGVTFKSAGYDENEGLYLISDRDEKFVVGPDLTGEDYDSLMESKLFAIHEMDRTGDFRRQYIFDPIPRELTPAFGV